MVADARAERAAGAAGRARRRAAEPALHLGAQRPLATLSAATSADVELPLTATLAPRWLRVAENGHADEDVSVVISGLSGPERR